MVLGVYAPTPCGGWCAMLVRVTHHEGAAHAPHRGSLGLKRASNLVGSDGEFQPVEGVGDFDLAAETRVLHVE
jgi:hypothetical protein